MTKNNWREMKMFSVYNCVEWNRMRKNWEPMPHVVVVAPNILQFSSSIVMPHTFTDGINFNGKNWEDVNRDESKMFLFFSVFHASRRLDILTARPIINWISFHKIIWSNTMRIWAAGYVSCVDRYHADFNHRCSSRQSSMCLCGRCCGCASSIIFVAIMT